MGLEGHDLMLKRLEDEAEQRVELEMRRKDLVNRRTATQADSKKRKNDLDNLTETLKKFIEVTIPVGETMPTEIERYTHFRGVSEVLASHCVRHMVSRLQHGRLFPSGCTYTLSGCQH